MDLLIAPDPEAALVAYLGAILAGVTVSTRRPATIPDSLVLVGLTGGGDGPRDVIFHDFRLALQVWGPDEDTASLLARTVAGLVEAWEGTRTEDSVVYTASCSSPRNFPDPDTTHPRYLSTASLTMRAVAVTL